MKLKKLLEQQAKEREELLNGPSEAEKEERDQMDFAIAVTQRKMLA